jgi:hypothetical protein
MGLTMLQRTVAAAADCADDEDALARLRPLAEDIGWLEAATAREVRRLRANPLAEPAIEAVKNGPQRHLVLIRTSRITVSVTMFQPLPGGPRRAHLPGHLTLSRLLAPSRAAAEIVTLAEPVARHAPAPIVPGEVLALDEARQALWFAPAPEPLSLLRIQLRRDDPPPARMVDLDSGTVDRLTAGDDRAARTLMMLTLLRTLGAREAIGEALAAAVTLDDGALRWAAVRECLALDTAASWPMLCALALCDPDPGFRAAAARTRLDIARRTAGQEQASCPA